MRNHVLINYIIIFLLFIYNTSASPITTGSGLVPSIQINGRICYINTNLELIDTDGYYVYGRPINFIPNPKVAKFMEPQEIRIVNEPFFAAAARINYIPFPPETIDGTITSLNFDRFNNLAIVYSNNRVVPLCKIER
jgi:hypothetical protein